MSILSALKQHNSSIDDLAKLPQAMIMQMAQKKQISEDMLAPILARKAEMMDAVSRSKSLQPQPPVPTVMEQVMAKNVQAENPQAMPPQAMPPQGMPAEAGIAQLPVPERQYAGGGIIAFARGDLVDLDEDTDEEDLLAEYAQAMAHAQREQYIPMEAPARINGVSEKVLSNENAGVGIRPPEEGRKFGQINYEPKGKHPYESLVTAKANEFGVDPRLAAYILNKETGGMKNPETARSHAGAMGIAQFMPATAKQYGINPDIPEEAAIGMNKHLKYLVNKYDDPKLAAIAYNWGEGNTNKWLKAGADMDKLPKETRKYVAQLAQGGEIKKFGKENSKNQLVVNPDDDRSQFQQDLIDNFGYSNAENKAPDKPKWLQDSIDYFSKPKNRSGKTSPYIPNQDPNLDNRDVGQKGSESAGGPGLTNEEMMAGSTRAGTWDALSKGRELPKPVKEEPEESFWEKLASKREASYADLVKQRSDDRNMALLAAGLGMMGGESPYAFANIGKGGLSGVSYLAEANKQRAAEKAALDKNELLSQRYKELGETALSAKISPAERQATRDVQVRSQDASLYKSMKDDARAQAIAGLKAQGLFNENLDTYDAQQKIEAATRGILSNDDAFQQTHQRLFGKPYGVGQVTSPTGNATLAEQAAAEKAKRDKEKK